MFPFSFLLEYFATNTLHFDILMELFLNKKKKKKYVRGNFEIWRIIRGEEYLTRVHK